MNRKKTIPKSIVVDEVTYDDLKKIHIDIKREFKARFSIDLKIGPLITHALKRTIDNYNQNPELFMDKLQKEIGQ